MLELTLGHDVLDFGRSMCHVGLAVVFSTLYKSTMSATVLSPPNSPFLAGSTGLFPYYSNGECSHE